MKALILNNKVVDVVATEFEVAPTMSWLDCTSECNTEWTLIDGVLTAPVEVVLTYDKKRKAEYDKLNQFEMMFDDDRDGTTTWVDKINEIKEKYPK